MAKCAHCGLTIGIIARTESYFEQSRRSRMRLPFRWLWVRCPACNRYSVKTLQLACLDTLSVGVAGAVGGYLGGAHWAGSRTAELFVPVFLPMLAADIVCWTLFSRLRAIRDPNE